MIEIIAILEDLSSVVKPNNFNLLQEHHKYYLRPFKQLILALIDLEMALFHIKFGQFFTF